MSVQPREQPSACRWCPVDASKSANRAVSAVHAVVGLPGQLVPGRSPPLRIVRARCAARAARSAEGVGACSGGPRKVTAASAPEEVPGRRW
jgi:hypothetical protein